MRRLSLKSEALYQCSGCEAARRQPPEALLTEH